MATKSEIEAQLAQNESQRNDLSAKIGPAQDNAQRAYDVLQSATQLRGQNISQSFTASFNGQTFTGPAGVEGYIAAAQSDFETKRDIRKDLAVEFNALFPVKESLEAQLATATDPTETIKSPEATNPSQSDQDTANKYATPDNETQVTTSPGAPDWAKEVTIDGKTGEEGKALPGFNLEQGRASALANQGIAPGAEKITPPPAKARTFSASGRQFVNDLRAKITVPNEYLTSFVPGIDVLKQNFNGIIFPYTPVISFDHTASYQSQQPLHSNFAINFYQRSAVSNISITAKFTVQNKKDAQLYIGTLHLLSALTKMKFGNDKDAGAPPPVCRLDAYGTYMLRNVPISISNFRFDLPDSVDYFVYDGGLDPDTATSVPMSSTLSIACVLMYSRREMQEFSVDSFVNQYARQKKLGYL